MAVNHRVESSSLSGIVFLYCRGVIGSTIVSKTISQGSSPCGRASLWDSSIGRASGFEPEGYWFDPNSHSHQDCSADNGYFAISFK